jgi:hypothetical protein
MRVSMAASHPVGSPDLATPVRTDTHIGLCQGSRNDASFIPNARAVGSARGHHRPPNASTSTTWRGHGPPQPAGEIRCHRGASKYWRRSCNGSEPPFPPRSAATRRSRNDSQDPYRGLITDGGQLKIPLDLWGTGFWLTALFGDPTTAAIAASGSIAFSAQLAVNSTITINGVTWTFVSGTPTGNQIEIGDTLGATLTNAAAALNGSARLLVGAAPAAPA